MRVSPHLGPLPTGEEKQCYIINMNYFYSHLIETDSLVVALNELKLSDEEKTHLLGIVQSSLHHAILDAILSELSDKDKKTFVDYVEENNNEKIWKFLNGKIQGIESKIQKAAEDLKKKVH